MANEVKGALDAGLEALGKMTFEEVLRFARAVNRAKERLAPRFYIGDEAWFVADVKPRTLAGREVVVVGFTPSKVVVDLKAPSVMDGKWGRGRIRVPPTMLRKSEKPVGAATTVKAPLALDGRMMGGETSRDN